MASDTTTPERMSAERLADSIAYARRREGMERNDADGEMDLAITLGDLLAHIAAVEAELEAARGAALEEAAKICDTRAANTLTMYQHGNKPCWFEHCAAEALAKSIRALKVEP